MYDHGHPDSYGHWFPVRAFTCDRVHPCLSLTGPLTLIAIVIMVIYDNVIYNSILLIYYTVIFSLQYKHLAYVYNLIKVHVVKYWSFINKLFIRSNMSLHIAFCIRFPDEQCFCAGQILFIYLLTVFKTRTNPALLSMTLTIKYRETKKNVWEIIVIVSSTCT